MLPFPPIRVCVGTHPTYEVMEFWGNGDPMFGGAADDRVLTADGTFARSGAARFTSKQEALAAAERAERRPGGIVSVLPAL